MKAPPVVSAAFAVLLAAGLTACGGSSKKPQGIDALLSQVRTSFGDRRLLAASVNGTTLTVKVAAHDEPSGVSATFEAQILAAAFHDSVSASGQTPIKTVRFLDASGKAIAGYGPATVGGATSPPPLDSGACKAAAQGVQSLVIESALTLPYAGGACAFTLQTSDTTGFAAGPLVYQLISAIGSSDQRSYLVEIDDQAGVPLFVDDYTPGGGGVSYVKPGSGILFGP